MPTIELTGACIETARRLDKLVAPARSGMEASKTILYANPETGTVVYSVYTSNATLGRWISEHVAWTYYLVGNNHGAVNVGSHVSSEARISIGMIRENDEEIVIPRSGTETIHFGIQVEVRDIVVKKSSLKPYEK